MFTKKILPLLLIAAILSLLASCGTKGDANTSESGADTPSTVVSNAVPESAAQAGNTDVFSSLIVGTWNVNMNLKGDRSVQLTVTDASAVTVTVTEDDTTYTARVDECAVKNNRLTMWLYDAGSLSGEQFAVMLVDADAIVFGRFADGTGYNGKECYIGMRVGSSFSGANPYTNTNIAGTWTVDEQHSLTFEGGTAGTLNGETYTVVDSEKYDFCKTLHFEDEDVEYFINGENELVTLTISERSNDYAKCDMTILYRD